MVIFDRAATAFSCPECGCADVERRGRLVGRNQFMCLEGHQFEVPRRPGVLTRWRNRKKKSN